MWNPHLDPHIPFHYDIEGIDHKAGNTRALREMLRLRDGRRPLAPTSAGSTRRRACT